MSFADLGRSEKLALLINAYNACTLRLILDHWNDGQLASIKDIPRDNRWEDQRWQIGKRRLSLNQIEHEEIRGRFAEPRIHFALVCAAKGCPPLRAEDDVVRAFYTRLLEPDAPAQTFTPEPGHLVGPRIDVIELRPSR